jgi:hypothetical protein
MAETSHVLTIVIPALNEEDAIGDTIRQRRVKVGGLPAVSPQPLGR